MVGGSCPALCGDGNKGLVRVTLGWHFRHTIEGENLSLPWAGKLVSVPSPLLMLWKLHNVPNPQSQLILIGRTVYKGSSNKLRGCRNEKQGG